MVVRAGRSVRPRKGRVVGDPQWTTVVVQRAIEVWKLMNHGSRPAAA
jgi:hypothetical protein